jgi:Tfp pilus assembly protein PilX
MRARLRNERGTAIVIAIMVVLVMTALALGTFTFVEGQQRASADERVRDSAYNLAEAGLESAVAYLTVKTPTSAQPWGYNATLPSGGACGPTSASTDNCPDPSSVTGSFNSATTEQDYAGSPNWTTTVVDNSAPATACTSLSLSGSCFYRESATCAPAGTSPFTCTQPKYDANGDGAVWVRSKATVQGRTRILVALVKAQSQPLPYPRNAIYAYDIVMSAGLAAGSVNTLGNAGVAAKVDLVCTEPDATPQYDGGGCPGADPNKPQIQPWTVTTTLNTFNSCVNEDGSVTAISCLSTNQGADVIALRKRAQQLGTYYTTCPTSAQLSGPLVFIEVPSLCTPGAAVSNTTWNSAANPGMIVFTKGNTTTGSITIGGTNNTYYGMIYGADEQGAVSGLNIAGTSQVIGAAIMDRYDTVAITSTHVPAFTYDPKAFNAVTTNTGPIKIIPGTFREVPPSS